jgi:hypothetical protein
MDLMRTEAPADGQLGDPRLTRLYRYWWDKRRDGRPPSRADLDPIDIPDLLPILNLLEVSWEPLGFRHRLVGTEVVDWLERDATGQDVGAGLYGPAADEIFETLKRLATEARPYHRRSRLDWHGRGWLSMESIELPLVGDDGRVAMILRGSSFAKIQSALPRRLDYVPLAPLG